MNVTRKLWVFIGVIVLTAALISGFVLMQTSAEDILTETLETAQTITEGHAVLTIDMNSVEKDTNGTIEVWARRGQDVDDEHPKVSFRIEVLESNQENAQGAVIVSDGKTLWAYSPSENKVFVGTAEEAQAMMEENQYMVDKYGDFYQGQEGDHEYEGEHPENAEEAVAKFLEYFNVSKSDTQELAGENADQLIMEPVPEQMPDEYFAVGGMINLWIGRESSIPLAVSYTGGSMGQFSATVLKYEVNIEMDDALFTFDIPAGAEVVTFKNLEPQSLTLEQASETAEFQLLTTGETPDGATLVDILEVRGSIVQRYTLPAGGSFTIAQGAMGDNVDEGRTHSSEGQSVEVRGTTGNMFASDDGTQILLTWTEGNLFYSIAGDLTAEQALGIAESLQ